MKFIPVACLGLACLLVPKLAVAEQYNLRNSCERWEFIPANEALQSPATAMMTCTDEETDAAWLSLQVLCFPDRKIIELRYQTGYEPLPIADGTDSANQDSPVLEMVSFMTSNGGYHHAGVQNPETGAWHFEVTTPHYPLFLAMASGNYIDVALGPVFDTERLPLRGSSKALAQVKQACIAIDKDD